MAFLPPIIQIQKPLNLCKEIPMQIEHTVYYINIQNMTKDMVDQLDSYFTKKYGNVFLDYVRQENSTQIRYNDEKKVWGYENTEFAKQNKYIEKFPIFFAGKFITMEQDPVKEYVYADISRFDTSSRKAIFEFIEKNKNKLTVEKFFKAHKEDDNFIFVNHKQFVIGYKNVKNVNFDIKDYKEVYIKHNKLKGTVEFSDEKFEENYLIDISNMSDCMKTALIEFFGTVDETGLKPQNFIYHRINHESNTTILTKYAIFLKEVVKMIPDFSYDGKTYKVKSFKNVADDFNYQYTIGGIPFDKDVSTLTRNVEKVQNKISQKSRFPVVSYNKGSVAFVEDQISSFSRKPELFNVTLRQITQFHISDKVEGEFQKEVRLSTKTITDELDCKETKKYKVLPNNLIRMFKCGILSGRIKPKINYNEIQLPIGTQYVYMTFDGRIIDSREILQENAVVLFASTENGKWTAEIVKNRFSGVKVKLSFEIDRNQSKDYFIERYVDIIVYNFLNIVDNSFLTNHINHTSEYKANMKKDTYWAIDTKRDTIERIRDVVNSNFGQKLPTI